MSDTEDDKNPKEKWLERLSKEPQGEGSFEETWTRTVFVPGKSKEKKRPEPEPAMEVQEELEEAQPDSAKFKDPLADANADVLIGQVIAEKYLIEDFVGKGGMSTIYSVKHMQLDTIYALKLLDKTMWSDPTAVKRFKLEAQTVSKLTHPNLITYRDFGVTADGQPYLVMDYIQGRTLGQRIKETHGMFLPTVLDVFTQLCEGLAVAHNLGIVHRDVKPGNIMFLSEDSDQVKLVDFGIAKIVSEEGSESQQLTKTGDVFGSPLYMSPEQCMGKKLDNRSDIYALGCVIFEAMTGKHAISGNTILDTMNRHVSTMPSAPSEVRPDLDTANIASWVDVSEFEYVVMKCLQKNPNDRYRTVDDLLIDLRKIKAQEKISRDAPVTSVKSLRRTEKFDKASPKEMLQTVATIVYLLIGLAVVGGVITFFVVTRPAPPPPATASVESRPAASHKRGDNMLLDGSDEMNDATEADHKAVVQMKEGNYTQAARNLNFALQTYRDTKKPDTLIAAGYLNLGKCYAKLEKLGEARDSYKAALAIYDKFDASFYGAQRKECYLGLADVMEAMKVPDEAKSLREKAANY